MAQKQALEEHRIRAAFAYFDYDNTGYITIEHLRELLPGEDVELIMKEADLDRDNVITYEEFSSLMCNGGQDTKKKKEAQTALIDLLDSVSPRGAEIETPSDEGVVTSDKSMMEEITIAFQDKPKDG